MNAKCDVVMKLSVFGTRTDRHTHTHPHKVKRIHPRYAGCKNMQCEECISTIFWSRLTVTLALLPADDSLDADNDEVRCDSEVTGGV